MVRNKARNKIGLQSSWKLGIIAILNEVFTCQQWYNQNLPNVLSWHHNSILCALAQWMMPAWQRHSSPWPALSENSIAWAVVRIENAFSCISRWVLGPSKGEMPIVLFIQYQRCWCLNLNKEGHWAELSVWLPFRTAVNAILLIRLLKASLPARSLCEGNTMQAVQTPQKGIALESHTSAVWPLAMPGRSVESPWTPSQGNRIDSKSVIRGARLGKRPRKWQLIVFPIYTFWCSAWVVEAPNSAKHTNLCLSPGCDWEMNPCRECFTFIAVYIFGLYSF